VELQERSEELQASGLNVVAISYDSEEVLSAFATRRGITYPLLSDDDSAAITAFGILNTVAAEAIGPNAADPAVVADAEKYVSVFGASPMIVGTPFPGTFIVDANGRVTSRFFEEFYRERNTTSSIMLRLGTDMNPVSGVKGETPHLTIAASQSNPDVTVGTKFSLVLDIEPHPGIHVYAPGAEELGYRVIGLGITAGADDAVLRAEPLAYAASEIYHFEPLDEHVPVYQKPFRLIQDVVIEAHPGVEDALADRDVITLSGQLDYQACDDSLCFDPVSVPLSWTVAVTQLDRQRAERD
jgi:peroxiredoxin